MPNFKKFFEELIKPLPERISASVTEASHPEIFKAVTELCEKAKIKPPKKIHLFKEAFDIPNAAMSNTGRLFLGEKMLETMGHTHETPVVSKELEAVIAHELGHSTRPNDALLLHNTMAAAPLVIFGGFKLFEYAKRRQKEKGHGNIQQHIEITAKEAEKAVDKKINESDLPDEQKHAQSRLKKLTINVIKDYALFVAAGIASIPITKLVGHPIEFAADKYSADLVGAEHMVSALKKLEQKVTEVMASKGVPDFVQKLVRMADYHPSTASRISHLGR